MIGRIVQLLGLGLLLGATSGATQHADRDSTRGLAAHALPAASGRAARLVATAQARDSCAARVLSYGDRDTVQHPIFDLDLRAANGGHLVYLGASRHTFDPTDPELAEFERAWDALKPTAAYYEGAPDTVPSERDAAVRAGGEPGLVRFLARRDGVRATSLEPTRAEEVGYLRRSFAPEQIKLFYVLRVVSELRDRRKLSPAELRTGVGAVLTRFSAVPGLEGAPRTPEELEAAYQRYWPAGPAWWNAPADWFNPLKSSSETGGVFTNEVNRASSGFRDVHMYTVLARAALAGERVFAVVGRDHVPMQAAALRCALSTRQP